MQKFIFIFIAVMVIFLFGIGITKIGVHDSAYASDELKNCALTAVKTENDGILARAALFLGKARIVSVEQTKVEIELLTLFRMPLGTLRNNLPSSIIVFCHPNDNWRAEIYSTEDLPGIGEYIPSVVEDGQKTYTSSNSFVSFDYPAKYMIFEARGETGGSEESRHLTFIKDSPTVRGALSGGVTESAEISPSIRISFYKEKNKPSSYSELKTWVSENSPFGFENGSNGLESAELMVTAVAGFPAVLFNTSAPSVERVTVFPYKSGVVIGSAKTGASSGEEESDLKTILEDIGIRSGDAATVAPQHIDLKKKTVRFKDGSEAAYRIADGFNIAVSAEDLGKARFVAKSPDGRIFVPDMVDFNLSDKGRIVILDDFNEKTKQFESKSVYLEGLRGANSVAFYKDKNGTEWIYVALTKNLIRYKYAAGDMKPQGKPEIIMEFPNKQSSNAIGKVWHVTRTVIFNNDTMYVSVGSGCNLCEEDKDEIRAMIIAANPDGKNMRVYAEGIKNAVGITFVDNVLYATENGTDHLGNDAPNDTLLRVKEGEHYGWPYCYELDGKKNNDTTLVWTRKKMSCADAPLSFASFPAHSAPLGVTYFGGPRTHPLIKNSFIVALHGSWQKNVGRGYELSRVSQDGETEVFMDGFLTGEFERVGRPVDILQWDDNSFLFTDDHGGRIYYVYAEL